jgi:anti-sigma B factor antagonist
MGDFTRSDGLLPLRCTASRPRPHVCVAYLACELDMGTAPFVTEYLREQTGTRPADLVLDLSGVTLLAAAGLALIVNAHKNEDGIHGRLHLTGVVGNRPVARVLQLTGLTQVLDVHDDLQALLDALPPS